MDLPASAHAGLLLEMGALWPACESQKSHNLMWGWRAGANPASCCYEKGSGHLGGVHLCGARGFVLDQLSTVR